MTFKPVDPKEEAERLYQKVKYERSDLYKEQNIIDKIMLALKGRSPKDIQRLWYTPIPNASKFVEKGFYYLYEVKGSEVEFYIDIKNDVGYFSITKYVGTKQYTRSCVIKEKQSFDRLWEFLSDQEKEYEEREKWLEDTLDELINGE